jgi:tetratricopeptide (TPR) repeat protein
MNIPTVPIEVMNIYNKALDCSIKGEFNTALDEYRRALNICPTFVEAYNNIGEIYSRIGKNDLAISTYQTALRIDRNPRLLLNIGVEYYTGLASFNLKDQKMAEDYFKNVVRLDNKHLKSNYLLSYIYYDWERYEKTLFHLNNIRDIADDKLFLNKYFGFCYYHLGMYDDALRYLNLAVESSPGYLKYRDYLKNLSYENKIRELGDIDARIREMERAMMGKQPDMHELTKLSLLYTYKGEYKKAEDILVSYKKQLK